MDALQILHCKRDGVRPHTDEEIEWWIKSYAEGKIPEYQMSAWLMAVCWRGMTTNETATLTRCMVESGSRVAWPETFGLKNGLVDKHSTGGVGDKISLILAPLVATFGVAVPMMAGRGLGHTGGTIDKLESIPGYKTGLSIEDFQAVVRNVGCSIVSASSEMCLADRKLYALRDVTATVSSIPLQTASIMCKKIAENPNSLVLDVKYGKASFQSNVEEAKLLASSMIATGEANGLNPTTCLLTHMDSVIGKTVGNWIEIEECISVLKGFDGECAVPDLVSLVVIEAAQMLHQSEKYSNKSLEELLQLCFHTLKNGKAFPKFQQMVEAHGGDGLVCASPEKHPWKPKHTQSIVASKSAYIQSFDGVIVGTLAVRLGAGRQTTDSIIDPMAGIRLVKKDGEYVKEGEEIAILYSDRGVEVMEQVANAFMSTAVSFCEEKPVIPFVVSHHISSKTGVKEFIPPKFLLDLFF